MSNGKDTNVMDPNSISCETCRHNDATGSLCCNCTEYSLWESKQNPIFPRCASCKFDGQCSDICEDCLQEGYKNWQPKSVQYNPEEQYSALKQNADHMHGLCASDDEYTSGSIVSKRSTQVIDMVDKHWNYVRGVIESGADNARFFSYEEVLKIREHDYKTAAKHFYGHGFEDCELLHEVMPDEL